MNNIDSLSLATKGYWTKDSESIDSLATGSIGYVSIILDDDGGIVIPPVPPKVIPPSKPSVGKGTISLPIDGFIQIFVQKGLTKTKLK